MIPQSSFRTILSSTHTFSISLISKILPWSSERSRLGCAGVSDFLWDTKILGFAAEIRTSLPTFSEHEVSHNGSPIVP